MATFGNTNIGLLFKLGADSSEARRELKATETEVSRTTGKIKSDLGGLDNATSSAGAGFTRLGNIATIALGNIAANAVLALASQMKQGATEVLDYSSRLEQVSISFKTLTGSAEDSKKLLKDLQEFAKTTPFEFADITSFAQKLLGANVEIKNIIPLLRDVGNATSAIGGTQEDLEGVVRAITQIIGKGKATAEELGQLAERNINGFKILASELGKTEAEVRKLSEQGKISSEVFLAAFQRFSQTKFGDAMEQQSKTFAGAMSNIKDALLITASTAFKPMFEQIARIALSVGNELNQLKSPSFADNVRVIGGGIGKALGESIVAQVRAEIKDFKWSDAFVPHQIGAEIAIGMRPALIKAFLEFDGLIVTALKNNSIQYSNLIDKVFGAKNPPVPVASQAQNYLNSDDLETRLPGQIDALTKATNAAALTIGDGVKKAAKTIATEILPAAGEGFASYKREKGGVNQYGTPETIDNIKLLASTFKDLTGKIIQIGDLSRGDQKQFGPHKGHRDLETLDVRPVRKDDLNLPVNINDAQYDQAATRALVELVKKIAPQALVRFNDPDLVREGLTRRTKGHDNHLDISNFGGKGNLVDLKKLAEERAAQEKQANEKIVKDREATDERILVLARNRENEEVATLNQLLAKKLISEKDYQDRVLQGEIDLLEKQRQLLQDRLTVPQTTPDDRIKIEQEIADITSEIKVKATEKSTAAIENETKALERQKQIAQEVADLRRQVLEEERRLTDFRKEQERKVLSNNIEFARGRDLLDGLVVRREFDIEEERRKDEARQKDIEAEKNLSIGRLTVTELEAGKREELEKLFYNRSLESYEEYQAKKKEIEESYKPEIDEATADAEGGIFGSFVGQMTDGLDKAEINLTKFSTVVASAKDIVGGAFASMGAAFGSLVQQWVLYGNAGGMTLRKFVATALAGVAAQAATLAIFHAAMGVAALTPWGAAIYGSPTQHFMAAALFGGISAATAIAGRLTAGASFSKQTAPGAATGGVGGQTQPDGNRSSGGTNAISNEATLREEDRFRRPQEVVHRHVVEVVTRDSHIVNTVRKDIDNRGDLHGLLIKYVEG